MNIEAEKIKLCKRILDINDASHIEALQETLDNSETISISDSQKQELDRRLERIERGETKFYTWDEVKERLRKAL